VARKREASASRRPATDYLLTVPVRLNACARARARFVTLRCCCCCYYCAGGVDVIGTLVIGDRSCEEDGIRGEPSGRLT